MTDKIQEARRALFEAYQKNAHRSDFKERGDKLFAWNGATYVVTWVNWDYQLWCAALDAVEIPTPANEFMSESFACGVEQMIDAIESTNLGIKVK